MNEQSSKKILFNKSTLLSLKAELLKKQEEVQGKKHLPQHNIQNFKPPVQNTNKKDKNEQKEKKSFRDNLKAVDTEELEACRKAKLALEKKSELYEHLSDAAGNSQLADRFLVDFKSKKQESDKTESLAEVEEVEEPYLDNDDEWTEYTDFLGRTRVCLKVDLEDYKKRDDQLIRIITERDKTENPDATTSEHTEQAQKPLLVQKTNDYLQLLRKKWEEKEKELLAKDKDIHYQDLLFDEARIHGVGYYSFSSDEAERNKQMEELMKRREETLKAQQQAEEIRKKRDKLIADRVAAARARQRARAGLPPEQPKDENEKDFTTCLLELLNKQKNEVDRKRKEEEKKIQEEKEKERQKLREAHIRDWDIGKEGVDDKVKRFREMTQEEYVEQQRSKRIEEFAPPKTKDNQKLKYQFDSRGSKVETNVTPETTWADVRPVRTPSPPVIGDISEPQGLYFSTKKIEKVVKYKNFVPQEPVPINNELSCEEIEKDEPVERESDHNHAEIAPPPTYDYYGPVQKRMKLNKPFSSDMREAMAQGTKSLEHKESNRKLPSHYDFTFD